MIKIALEAVGFITNDISYNKNRIIKAIEECEDRADLLVFGETFLQGFQSLCWNFEKDRTVAVAESDPIISEIRDAAKANKVAVSFGYIEKADDKIYSSQLTIDKEGKTISNFRRVSPGWKEEIADEHYCEGKEFPAFEFEGKVFSVGLCGDLWFDENCVEVEALKADIVLWPVYTDFNFTDWNSSIKNEYAEQAAKIGKTVLYVNSYCLDMDDDEIARGGAAVFSNGKIIEEVPAGEERVLLFEEKGE